MLFRSLIQDDSQGQGTGVGGVGEGVRQRSAARSRAQDDLADIFGHKSVFKGKRTDGTDYEVKVTLTWNAGKWDMTNDKSATAASSATGDLTVAELADYLAKVFGEGTPPADLNASVSGNSLMVKSLSGTTPVSFDDATQAFLQFREEHVSMHQRSMTTTEALGIKGSF